MKRAAKFSILAVSVSLALAGCTATPEPEGPLDQQAPVIESVTVTPAVVGVNESMQVAAVVSDDVGVTGVAFVVRFNSMPAGFCSGSAELTAGTPQSGTWTIACTTPAALNSGQYQVNTAALDAAFNSQVTGDGDPSPTSGHFTVSGEVSDLEGPAVASVTSAPNVAARGGNVTITASVTDATGVANVGFVVRRNGGAPGWCAGGAELISGTPTDGLWQLTCVVPVDAESGAYTVNTAAVDVLNNVTGLGDDAPSGKNGAFSVG